MSTDSEERGVDTTSEAEEMGLNTTTEPEEMGINNADAGGPSGTAFEDSPVTVHPDEDFVHATSPGTYPLREAPWRRGLSQGLNPDDFLFSVSADRFRDVLTGSMSGLVDPETRLRGLLGATFDFADSDPHAFTTILSMHHAELARGSVDPSPLEIFKQVLHDGMQEGVFWDNDPALASAWVVALVQRTVVLAQSRRFEGAISEVRAMAVDAAVRLVKTPLSTARLDEWLPPSWDDEDERPHPFDEQEQ